MCEIVSMVLIVNVVVSVSGRRHRGIIDVFVCDGRAVCVIYVDPDCFGDESRCCGSSAPATVVPRSIGVAAAVGAEETAARRKNDIPRGLTHSLTAVPVAQH